MNDGMPKCSHGHVAREIQRPDLGPGWVQPIADGCTLCALDPSSARLPYKVGDKP